MAIPKTSANNQNIEVFLINNLNSNSYKLDSFENIDHADNSQASLSFASNRTGGTVSQDGTQPDTVTITTVNLNKEFKDALDSMYDDVTSTGVLGSWSLNIVNKYNPEQTDVLDDVLNKSKVYQTTIDVGSSLNYVINLEGKLSKNNTYFYGA